MPHKAFTLQNSQNHGLQLFCSTSFALSPSSAKTCYAPTTAQATMFCQLSSEACLLTEEKEVKKILIFTAMAIIRSLLIFILAGLFEIGGGYLVWQWLKEGKPLWYGLLGAVILALYGVVATWQTANFGRVYATYGGIFIVLALLWAWKVDGFRPDRYDILGAFIALIGACIIIYMPRGA